MTETIKETVERLTINQLKSIIDVIKDRGFFTDECRTSEGHFLLSKVMIKHSSDRLIERLQQETDYGYRLNSTGLYHKHYGEVLALFSYEFFEDTLDFERNALAPFIEKAINNMYS